MQNQEVRLRGERDGLPRECLGALGIALPREQLRPHRPPLNTCREIIGGRRLLADLAQLQRSLVAALRIESIRELRRKIREVLGLADVLEDTEAPAEVALGGG